MLLEKWCIQNGLGEPYICAWQPKGLSSKVTKIAVYSYIDNLWGNTAGVTVIVPQNASLKNCVMIYRGFF